MGRRKKKARKGMEEKFPYRETVDDFDEQMAGSGVKKRSKLGKKMMKKILKAQSRQKELKKRMPETGAKEGRGFHRVSVFVKDERIDKTFLLSSIGNYVDIPFCPLGYFRASDSITFYFDSNTDVAESIKSLDRRIQSPSGEIMGIKVDFVNDADFILNCDQVVLLRNVMTRRLAAPDGLLNLSCLHLDEELVQTNTFVQLSNQRILKQVLTIIKETMPNICALDLSNNKLSDGCMKLMEILEHCRSLFAMNLENNNISCVKMLKYLKQVPLKELKVMGNKFNEYSKVLTPKLIKSIRKELPFLKVIDGQNVSEVGGFLAMNGPQQPSTIIHPATSLVPVPEMSHVSENSLKTFLEQYYTLVDSEDKLTLLQAYVPTARIELKSHNPLIPSRSFEGHEQIKEFLNVWPKSKHDLSSFDLNVHSITPQEGVTEVKGALCLLLDSQLSLAFKRTMKIIPYNAGFCCSEDLLEIQ